MSRGAHSFKQGDVTKVIKGVEKAGVKHWRIEFGEFKIFGGDSASSATKDNDDPDLNEWDDVK